MLLLTKKIIQVLPSLYATDNVALREKIVICKFFTPDAQWSWFVFEGEKQSDGNFNFFGMVHSDYCKEMGYFCLSALCKIRGQLGLSIERDRFVFKVPYRKLESD